MTSRNPGKGRFGVYRGKQLVGTEHDRDRALSGARIVGGTRVRDSETGRDYEPDRHHPQVAWTNPRGGSRKPLFTTGLYKPLEKAAQFFYDRAGYSYDPKNESAEQGRRRAAQEYAIAESWASAEGYTFEWEHDPEPWEDMFEHPEDIEAIRDGSVEVYVLTMRDGRGNVRQSLGAIGLTKGPEGRQDARVFEAELALEEYNRNVRHSMGPIGPKSTRR